MGRGNVGRSLKFSVKNPVAATRSGKGEQEERVIAGER